MSDLVERLRYCAAKSQDYGRPKDSATLLEVVAALEAAQAIHAGLPDPDMPAKQLRLHMGEMTAQEMRTARAAIRWANSAAQARIEAVRRGTVEECAQHLTTLADAMHEKAEAISERASRHGPFARPPVSERDAAVMAYDFEQAAAAIRALTEAKEDRT
ncbi:hypothetical protein [Aureimonas pseudogalii]|uniref:Acyl-CoA reductase-like NAD-dependent aldehyde dehydrogenase n=1 Tax=Aureimonas pseudogalii TaxID=1744844 RepID=A0A7W6EG31_9HYPH|nr:hypothetical protein [Aureimonas pseudogalii]MBB3997259.1 acyl-CoA reductase-like NAD-dependent aldehyde dehydrogenase [Aureimonas pseudogalii]